MNINETINEISKLEYLIAMRFHACLVATKSGVKTLGINYDVKVKNLADLIGFPIIELNQKVFKDEFEEFLNLNTKKYQIPKFNFPSI